MKVPDSPSSLHRSALLGLGIFGLACACHQVSASNPPLDRIFSTDGGHVAALALQPDGGLLVGGSFISVAGQPHFNLARMAGDGTPDSRFRASADGYVSVLALQEDGRILVGGGFITTINGVPSSNLGRLNSDGSRDVTFSPVVEGDVYALAVQEDGKILVGGGFVKLAGQPHANLGRLNSDGTLDESFIATADSAVTALCIQPDGHILVGGLFNQLGGQARPRLGRLRPDGSVEAGFTPEVGLPERGSLAALAVQPDGRILVGGDFQTLGGEPHANVGRLFADGSVDSSFNPSAEIGVATLAVQADGRILVGGGFFEFCGEFRHGLGRLNPDGSLDEAYDPGTDPMITALLIQPDGKAIASTDLFGIYRLQSTDPVENDLAWDAEALVWSRGNSGPAVTGAVFEYSDDGENWTLLGEGTATGTGWRLEGAVVPEEQTVRVRGNAQATQSSAAGWTAMEAFYGPPLFLEQPIAATTVDFGSEVILRARIAGSGPPSYQWQKDGEPLIDGDGVAGAETAALTLTGVTGASSGVYTLVATNSLGSHTSQEAQLNVIEPVIISQPADQTPAPGETLTLSVEVAASDPISFQWQRDGEVLVDDGRISGSQTSTLNVTVASSADDGLYTVTISNAYGSVTSREALVRVAVVTVDPAFAPAGTRPWVTALALQPDARILVGGAFLTLAGEYARDIGRLFPDGRFDSGFAAATEDNTFPIAVQDDGRILEGGDVRRLEPDGTPAAGFFSPNPDDKVFALLVQPDGKIVLGGEFRTLHEESIASLARLNADGTLDTGFDPGAGGLPLRSHTTTVHALAWQLDGDILVGGWFQTPGSNGRSHIARLHPDGSLDLGFKPTANEWVHALAVQPDGRILVAGNFTTISGKPRNHIARLNADGSLDTTFQGTANGEIVAVALQANGKILVTGSFTELGGEEHHYLGRLNPDGSVDPSLRVDADGEVYGLGLQPDGNILVGGRFTKLGEYNRGCLGRLINTDPVWDDLINDGSSLAWDPAGGRPEMSRILFDVWSDGSTWSLLGEGTRVDGGWRLVGVRVPPESIIRARGLVAGGRYNGSSSWVGAHFGPPLIFEQPLSQTNQVGTTATFTLRADGTGPLSYQWFKDGAALEEDATVLGVHSPTLTLSDLWGPAGGVYTVVVSNSHGEAISAEVPLTVTGDPGIVAEPANQAVNVGGAATFQFGVEGTEPLTYQWWHDGTELPGANAASLVLTNVQAAQAGEYQAVAANDYGTVTSQVVTLGVNQALPEVGFDPVVNGDVYAVAVQPDHKILLGGKFTTVNGQPRPNLARLLPDGSLDPEFDPGADSPVRAFGIQPDGSLLIAGEFTTLAGEPRQRIARLDADDALDADFHLPVDDSIYALALQSDGRILIGGRFTTLDGDAHARIGRLNPDGSVDDGFSAGVDSNGSYTPSVRTFAVQPDGRIVVGGYFAKMNGEPASSIGRLNPDGSLDENYEATAGSIVECLTLQPDGRILIGGRFTSLGGVSIGSRLGRLNVDGTLDTSFQPLVDGTVLTLALQTDGTILIGGSFGAVGDVSRLRIARLTRDGSVDPGFDPQSDRDVYAIALQADGRVLAGGGFNQIAGVNRKGLCRLDNTGAVVETLVYDDSVFWMRAGAAPEVWRATFEHTEDGSGWTFLGDGVRIPGGWVVTPPTTLTTGNIRVRGYFTGAQNNGSSGFVEKYQGPPLFLRQPVGQVAPMQSLATFSARVVGSEPLSYQWHLDGLPLEDGNRISGSQTPVLTVRNLTGADSGEYTLVAANGSGETTSDGAVLTVLDPWIILQPESQTAAPGQNASFETYAVGTGALSYQWWKDGVELPGANEPWLDLTGLTADDAGDYWVVVTGPYGSSTSEVATLEVVLEPSIVTQPASQVGGLGQQVSFAVKVQGETPITYEWYRNGELLSDGGNVSGSQTATLTLSDLTPDDAADYSVRATNAFGSDLSNAARLAVNSAGVDGSFQASTSGYVTALALQTDGQILVGGSFSTIGDEVRSRIGRLRADGSLDPTYDPAANRTVRAIAVQTDGTAVVGGEFTVLAGESRDRIARVTPDGSLDPDFNPGASGTIYTLLEQPDGRILVGGDFTSLGGSPRSRIGRLNPDGSLDAFSPSMDGTVACVAVLPDGDILAGGSFTKVNNQTQRRLVRLNSDGSVDSSFAPKLDSSYFASVNVLAVQPDGRILLGGRFSEINGEDRDNLARLNPDGTLDADFAPDVNRYVYAMALQADGAILLGGEFTSVNGLPRDRLARIAPAGSLDPDFCPPASGVVYALALQADGGLLVGGNFAQLGGEDHADIGRVINTTEAAASLTRLGDTLTWLRNGSGPEAWRVTFEHSSDARSWSPLGEGTRIEGGWELSEPSLPEAGWFRARAHLRGGEFGGCGYHVEAHLGAPLLTWLPMGQTAAFGATVTFTAMAASSEPVAWQWFRDGAPLSDDARVSGAQTATLRIVGVSGGDADGYTVTITGDSGGMTSEEAPLTVLDPFITRQPASQTRGFGQDALFEVGAVGSDPVGYQWQKGGVDVPGATGPVLDLPDLQESDAGEYRVVVTTDYGSVVSNPATLDLVSPPLITSQPISQVVERGADVLLQVVAAGVEPLEYEWWKDGALLAGAEGPSLDLPDAQTSDSGWYQVVVRNSQGESTSDLVSLSVNAASWDLGFAPELSFYPLPRATVVAIQPDHSLLVGGGYRTTDPAGNQALYRFLPDGTRDSGFHPDANLSVSCLAIQPNGRILVGGSFNTLAGSPRRALGRLLTNGRLDHGFDPRIDEPHIGGTSPRASTLVVQPDGRIVVGGEFYTVGGEPRRNLARFQPDGMLDAAFSADANGQVIALALQPDGRILVAGAFTQLAGEPRSYLGRLNLDGSLDQDFNPAPNQSVRTLAVQPDRRILVGGFFTSIADQPVERIARLHADGTLDMSFDASANNAILSFGLQTDGRLLVTGIFRTLDGLPRDSIGRLNPDGSLDLTFLPEVTWNHAGTALQEDGLILVGADSWAGTGYLPPAGFGRLLNTDPATQSLEYDGSTITWLRGGTSPEVWRVTFEHSLDGAEWSLLDAPSRIPGGWELTDVSLPGEGTLRARGYVTSGQYNGSHWFVETLLSLAPPTPPQILVGDGSPWFTGEGFGFDVAGTADTTVVIDVSLDLWEWVELETVTLGNEPAAVHDPNADLSNPRFYRVRQIP